MNRLLVVASLAAVAFAAHRYLSRRRRRLPAASRLPTYVISLARRPARRRAALERLRAAGLEDLKCFDAIDGRELCADALQARGVEVYSGWRLSASACRFFNRSLKWGEVGCALSHHAVWELAAASEDEAVLVLEDDVELLPGFCELLQETVLEVEALVQQGATSEPDLLYLTRRAMKPGDDVPVGDRGRARGGRNTRIRLVTPGFSYKTTAYILYKRGAQKLLQSGFLRKVGFAVLSITYVALPHSTPSLRRARALLSVVPQLIPVDDFLNVLFTTHEVEPGLARPDLDLLFADAPRLNVLAVKPQLARERRGISDTENSTELVQ